MSTLQDTDKLRKMSLNDKRKSNMFTSSFHFWLTKQFAKYYEGANFAIPLGIQRLAFCFTGLCP